VGWLRRLFGGAKNASTDLPRGIRREDALAAYVIREHKEGRNLDEILDDPYLKNRATEEQRLRLLEHPDVIKAVGEEVAELVRARVRGS
jgi:hypothetical protein